MKIKIPKLSIKRKQVEFLLFCLMVLTKSYSDALISHDLPTHGIDDIKYYVMVTVIIIEFCFMIKKRHVQSQFIPDLKRFLVWITAWIIISILLSMNSYSNINETIRSWLFLIFPFVYSFCVLYRTSCKEIEKYFKATLIISLGFYLLFELGYSVLTIENLRLISFFDSYSPFESAYSSGAAIGVCGFFCYTLAMKQNRFWCVLSMLFCFLTFKRLAVIMMLIYYFVPKLVDANKRVKHRTVFLQGSMFILAAEVLRYALHPTNYLSVSRWFLEHFSIALDQLFMGRIRLYHLLVNSGYKSAGYGSCESWMNRLVGKENGIELELVQLLLEVSILGVIVFLAFCYGFAKNNLYSILIIDYMLLNMLTSSSLTSPFSWILVYLTIGYIRKKNEGADNKCYNIP